MAFVGKFTVLSGHHARSACPVSVFLPKPYTVCPALELTDQDSGRVVPSQVTAVHGGIEVTWIVSGLPADSERVYVAKGIQGQPSQAHVAVHDVAQKRKVEVSINRKLFTAYHYGAEWVRPFLYPLIGPGGARMTRGWPIAAADPGEATDYPHQKSIWTGHSACGRVDHWSEEPGHGWQRHRRFRGLESGPVFGRLVAVLDWCTHSGRKQFEEVRSFRFLPLPGGGRMIDMTVTFHMSEGPVIFHDAKEGGLVAVRVRDSMRVENGGRIENAQGEIDEPETWGTASPWCDYSGKSDGQHVGVAVFDNESNPRFPTHWLVRDYGLLAANSFASRDFGAKGGTLGNTSFRKGQRTTWRYRLYVHKGNASAGHVRDRYLDYAAPPEVRVN